MAYALADCNAFYVSAHTLFMPWLRDKAVCVASNNDGCVVSRNDPAKALGIKMGAPVFQLKELMERGELTVFSSNFELYQSLSNRVMATLEELSPRLSVYSVDEAFADLSGLPNPYLWGVNARDTIMQRLGLPIGVGIAPTLTLAKLANWAAKKWKRRTGCVVEMLCPEKREKLLRYAPVEEVWGIGPRLAERLRRDMQIDTAWKLATADPKTLRRHFNVNVERTARELTGMRCFPFGASGPERKQMIACTRSFGNRVTTREGLQQAVAAFVANAAAKLRQQGSAANCMQVFARTSFFSQDVPYSRSIIVELPYPCADTRDLTSAAMGALESIYQPGVAFAKAGVVLSQFTDATGWTPDLFGAAPRPRSEAVMKVMDAINARQGRGTIKLARDTSTGGWTMQRRFLTPAYTTRWDGLPRANS
ncbi:TPA: translesion error-prone DNA polymerase V subunit UmuC [Pseudomonas aeruginosa]|uniref:translesion error-prone DNA polymerase V subunit UmuC n=1 Tax=Pseudomonas aeruginosa TaxID=287 RepID=UPI0032B39AF8